MAHHIFQLESELQNIPEAAPEASRSFSVSEKLARYGSSALSGVEHLTLLVGKKSVALALIRHFGSLKAMARASFQELRQFLPRRQAESVVAALGNSLIEEHTTRSRITIAPESAAIDTIQEGSGTMNGLNGAKVRRFREDFSVWISLPAAGESGHGFLYLRALHN